MIIYNMESCTYALSWHNNKLGGIAASRKVKENKNRKKFKNDEEEKKT